ncbi:hypothetical protein A4R44_06063 [Amycolatopsis sp. M39]|nr:hypothetical protein A4R44_06063 [Amycolatopsis sp. M39]
MTTVWLAGTAAEPCHWPSSSPIDWSRRRSSRLPPPLSAEQRALARSRSSGTPPPSSSCARASHRRSGLPPLKRRTRSGMALAKPWWGSGQIRAAPDTVTRQESSRQTHRHCRRYAPQSKCHLLTRTKTGHSERCGWTADSSGDVQEPFSQRQYQVLECFRDADDLRRTSTSVSLHPIRILDEKPQMCSRDTWTVGHRPVLKDLDGTKGVVSALQSRNELGAIEHVGGERVRLDPVTRQTGGHLGCALRTARPVPTG